VEPGEHLDLLLDALAAEADAHRSLLAGDEAAGRAGLAEAARRYRASWEVAPPASYGRLVGMLKAAVLAGEGADEAAYVRAALADAPASPTASYALAVAALVAGDDAGAFRAAEGMRAGDAAFRRAADAIAALAAEDVTAYEIAVRAIVLDFEGRAAHLTGVPIADTALMLERLAEARGMACRPHSTLLPAGA
jgi:hypothetical protein